MGSSEAFGAYRGGTYTRSYLTMFWLMGAVAVGGELVAERRWTPLTVLVVVAAMGVVVLVGTAQTVLDGRGVHQVLRRRHVPWSAVAQVLDPLPGETELRLCLTDGTVLTARGVPPRAGPAVRAVVRRAHPRE